MSEAHDYCNDEIAKLKLQVEELRKTLGGAIQYVEHSRIGHPRNEETLEVTFDPTCFKCKALRVYFGPEEGETLKREGLCTNDRDGEKCLKAAGHEGICEGPQHVWDWKPTYGKRKD